MSGPARRSPATAAAKAGTGQPGRHNVRDGSGRFAPKQQLDPRMRPHHPVVKVTPQAAPDISPTVPYSGDSPTGYDPYTMGTF